MPRPGLTPKWWRQNGISAEELARFKHPASFADCSGALAHGLRRSRNEYSPQMDPGLCRAPFPRDRVEVVTWAMSETTPPVQVASVG